MGCSEIHLVDHICIMIVAAFFRKWSDRITHETGMKGGTVIFSNGNWNAPSDLWLLHMGSDCLRGETFDQERQVGLVQRHKLWLQEQPWSEKGYGNWWSVSLSRSGSKFKMLQFEGIPVSQVNKLTTSRDIEEVEFQNDYTILFCTWSCPSKTSVSKEVWRKHYLKCRSCSVHHPNILTK